MVCVLVPLLLKRKVGVLFGVLSGPCSDTPPPPPPQLVMVPYRCEV
jgi:hypothetical protein